MPRARADKFGSARAAVKPRCFRGMRREHRKNRTRIGPHLAKPSAAERPAISVLEIGYVRRSESIAVHNGSSPIGPTLPIRFLPTPPRCRVLPGTGVKLRIGRCGNAARDAEQG